MPNVLRLILWPSVITLVVSLLRFVLQVQGVVGTRSGGGLAPLGITWLVFLFGAWFGIRYQRSGSGPKLRWPVLWAGLAFVAIVAAVGLGFGAIDRADQTETAFAALRVTVGVIALVAISAAACCFVVWRRLAWTMLLYGLGARLTVVAITYVAKVQGSDTHYTKFGPAGIERDLGGTMLSASLAQMGFWVPFTIVGGVLAGTVAARLAGQSNAA